LRLCELPVRAPAVFIVELHGHPTINIVQIHYNAVSIVHLLSGEKTHALAAIKFHGYFPLVVLPELRDAMGSVGASFFQGRLQLEKTRCRQALRQVPPVHLHGKALPKLLQFFEFVSWFAIFWICQNFVFWIVLDPRQTVLLLIVHDLATPHDALDDNGAGSEDSESGSALLKARTKVRQGYALAIVLTLIHDLAIAQELFDGYAEPLCDHGCLRKSDRLSFGPCHDRGCERRKRNIFRPVLFHV
jgi:hypothetical protein